MTTGEQQRVFTRKLADLIIYAYDVLGLEASLGDAARMDRKGHSKHSYHYLRLAIDINLFKRGVYLDRTEDHAELGKYWKALGGTWGGDFKRPDGNHYSWNEGR